MGVTGTPPEALSGWDVFQAVIDLAREHDLPVPQSITLDRVYAEDYRQVLAWARAFGVVAEVYDGSRDGQDRIQACVSLPDVGLGRFFDVLGSGQCPTDGTDHDHAACVAAALSAAGKVGSRRR
jgi:hypothetical protein